MKLLKFLPILCISFFSVSIIETYATNPTTELNRKKNNGSYLEELKYLRTQYNKLLNEYKGVDAIIKLTKPAVSKINNLIVNSMKGKTNSYSDLIWLHDQLQNIYELIGEANYKQELNEEITSKMNYLYHGRDGAYSSIKSLKDSSVDNYLEEVWGAANIGLERYDLSIEELKIILDTLKQIEYREEAIKKEKAKRFPTSFLSELDSKETIEKKDSFLKYIGPIFLNNGHKDKNFEYTWSHPSEFYTKLSTDPI